MNRNARKLVKRNRDLEERNKFLEENRQEMIDDRKFWSNMYSKLHNEFMKNNKILG